MLRDTKGVLLIDYLAKQLQTITTPKFFAGWMPKFARRGLAWKRYKIIVHQDNASALKHAMAMGKLLVLGYDLRHPIIIIWHPQFQNLKKLESALLPRSWEGRRWIFSQSSRPTLTGRNMVVGHTVDYVEKRNHFRTENRSFSLSARKFFTWYSYDKIDPLKVSLRSHYMWCQRKTD